MITKDDLKYNELCYDGTPIKNKKYKKLKQQCNVCGYIDYRLSCPKCGGGMFRYVNRIGK